MERPMDANEEKKKGNPEEAASSSDLQSPSNELSPRLIVESYLKETFGENWYAYLKASGAIVSEPKSEESVVLPKKEPWNNWT